MFIYVQSCALFSFPMHTVQFPCVHIELMYICKLYNEKEREFCSSVVKPAQKVVSTELLKHKDNTQSSAAQQSQHHVISSSVCNWQSFPWQQPGFYLAC